MEFEDFSTEIGNIQEGIDAADNLLDDMMNDDLIAGTYGDEIRRVLRKLGEARSESEYIENNLPSDDGEEYVTKDDVIANIESLISEIRGM